MNEESIIGLLLRAHGHVAAQALNEERLGNISASQCWQQSQKAIENAIWQAHFADNYVRAQEARESESRKHAKQQQQEASNGR